jgi:small redox-active disulfide protein 2
VKDIKVLGTGCPKCTKMAEVTESVASSLKIEYNLTKVTDITEIISFGVMITPALVVDGVVKVSGRVPSEDEMKEMLA